MGTGESDGVCVSVAACVGLGDSVGCSVITCWLQREI